MDDVKENAKTGLRKAEVTGTDMLCLARSRKPNRDCHVIGFVVIGNKSLSFNPIRTRASRCAKRWYGESALL